MILECTKDFRIHVEQLVLVKLSKVLVEYVVLRLEMNTIRFDKVYHSTLQIRYKYFHPNCKTGKSNKMTSTSEKAVESNLL